MKRILLFVVMVSSVAFAKEPANPAMPVPAAELDQFKGLAGGTWKCTGKSMSHDGGEIASKSTIKVKLDLGKHFYVFTHEFQKPMKMKGMSFLGWDPGAKKFVMHGANSMGGMIDVTSAGWSGDAVVFEGTMAGMGEPVPIRMTFTKTGAKATESKMEMQGPGGWQQVVTETCKK